MSESENLKAKIVGTVFAVRTGPKTQHPKELIINFPSIKTANEAARLIGRKVSCSIGKQAFRGKITATHAKNGLVRARFRKGLPGQIGMRVELVG